MKGVRHHTLHLEHDFVSNALAQAYMPVGRTALRLQPLDDKPDLTATTEFTVNFINKISISLSR